ncbi:ISL3 family transposase [Limnoglobus roseus]|uniref:ISL3 family transposase n=1 Tax=Limnoglobus roseus TaxID=2598579 RepID=A0A5C1ARG1_9BACT|nr:ISL3 family transposase [Limnoglobus roseus]
MFCERLPELTEPHARTTSELTEAHRRIGLALGGEAGARLAAALGLPTSPDTILCRVQSGPDEPAPRPRYVGLDDWATRKGHTYGTILVDLERGTVIDLLPGRDGEAVKAWLAANPQVEVITRDRWPAYIQAATSAAPQAKQVADRFHLLTNVREAVEKILSRVASDVRAANATMNAPALAEPAVPPASPEPAVPLTDTQQRKAAKRQAREERFRRVKVLTAEGLSVRQIARRLRMSYKAILRYRRQDRCPDWEAGQARPSALDPFTGFVADWIAAGNRNSRDLYRALRAKGFAGGYDAARRYLNRRIGSTGRPGRRAPTAVATPAERTPPSARKLSFRVANPKPDGHSAKVLTALRAGNPSVHAALATAEELMAMIRKTSATPLAEWITKATALGDRDLSNLAASLASDAAAVQAALTEPWSNGQVEGQVGRLKAIKRQMFGRAGMKLLRARVRHKG